MVLSKRFKRNGKNEKYRQIQPHLLKG